MGYEQSVSPKKKVIGLLLAVLFHVLLIYALVTGMARDFIKKAQQTLEVSIIEEVKLPPPPPPPPPPKEQPKEKIIEPPKAYVPPVEVKVDPPPAEAQSISSISASAPTPPVVAPVSPPPPPPPEKPNIRVKPALMSGCRPPAYPEESIEMEEQGTVIFAFLVGVNGRVIDSKLSKSSGFTRLDDAARRAFEKCQFSPGTLDGVPENAWVQQSFEWKLK